MTKAAYVALGINSEGYKDILGIWIGENEGAKFWLKVCNELKNRGIQDILIICIDGLKGFPDAIHTVFPETKGSEKSIRGRKRRNCHGESGKHDGIMEKIRCHAGGLAG